MSTTADTFHVPMYWSKEEALLNMERMVVTADTSHAPMSGLHVSLPVAAAIGQEIDQWLWELNRHCMSVIALTSQPEMSP